MRYNQETTEGEKIDSDSSRTLDYLPAANRAKRRRQQLRDYLVREFSLNQVIANARKTGISLKL